MNFPISYIEPVFRPPSEARSLILPVTNGCSWNRCTYCEMYTAPQKKFFVRPEKDVISEIKAASRLLNVPKRIFLADGDAMALSTRRLVNILEAIRTYLPNTERVSSYCLPRNLKKKTVEELTELASLGLKILYIGCESGDDKVLNGINKGEDFESSKSALLKAKNAGIKSSVMILNGIGGEALSENHAINSAKLMNETQPDYLSTLVVSFPAGRERFNQGFDNQFVDLSQQGLFRELKLFVQNLNLDQTVFRSDHASNYLVLKGVLNKDKERILSQIDTAIHQPDKIYLREEWQRGL